MYQKYIKRLLDVIFSGILLVITSPILLVVAILISVKLGTPVVFKQNRTGRNNRIFTMYKFRSMTEERDENGELLPDHIRLTKFGEMLRATSLDELPGLLNIFKGDMSFVGPRPLLPNYVDLYSPRQLRRHEVMPGLTGLAQINGRNAIQWEEKFEYDLDYVEHLTFRLDCAILFHTVKKVFARADINAGDGVTMEAFRGTKRQRFGAKNQNGLRVMFVGAGNKVELIKTFLYAAGSLGIEIDTFGVDVSLGLPGMLACKRAGRCVPPQDPQFPAQILEICQEEKINLVIPLDEADTVLAKHHDNFKEIGVTLLLSPMEVVELSLEKSRVIEFFKKCQVNTVEPVDNIADYTGGYPAIIELKNETKGIYSYRADSEKELAYYAMRFENYLIRPFLLGEEYEIDVMCDLAGNPVYITPKIKEHAQTGEISRFRVVQDDMMILEAKCIVETLKPVGPVTLSAIKDVNSNRNYFIALRSIFSQNVTVSIKAGADGPLAILKQMYGLPVTYVEHAADDGIIFSRIEQSVQIKPKEKMIQKFKDFKELSTMSEEIDAVVFDLDDVLFSEKQYMRSGLRAVASQYSQIKHCFNRMCVAMEKGQMPIETVFEEDGILTKENLEAALEIYRSHDPQIKLYSGVEEIFRTLHTQKKQIAVLTDGNPIKQRKKIESLGLESMVDEILITDELAGKGNVYDFRKPNDLSYLIMKTRLGVPLRNIAYVGVNAEKDFTAPLRLGMQCWLYENQDHLYNEV